MTYYGSIHFICGYINICPHIITHTTLFLHTIYMCIASLIIMLSMSSIFHFTLFFPPSPLILTTHRGPKFLPSLASARPEAQGHERASPKPCSSRQRRRTQTGSPALKSTHAFDLSLTASPPWWPLLQAAAVALRRWGELGTTHSGVSPCRRASQVSANQPWTKVSNGFIFFWGRGTFGDYSSTYSQEGCLNSPSHGIELEIRPRRLTVPPRARDFP